ncbi:hypothetical protein KAW65_00680 [candidate division WOR-3 bacterium]|nr:hypothetical protein [candidate division WOR-3 bacterium]
MFLDLEFGICLRFGPSADGLGFGILKDMFLNKSLPWGEIRGKLSLTPSQAQKMLGFKMKKNAKGVILQRNKKGGRIIVRNLMPCKPTETKKLKRIHKRIIDIQIIVKQIKDLIKDCWNPAAPYEKYSGYHYFISINASKIKLPPDWKKMQMTIGPGKIPRICKKGTIIKDNIISIKLRKIHTIPIGVIILDRKTKEVFNINPRIYKQKQIKIKLEKAPKSPVAFIYTKVGNIYSNSIPRVPKVFRNEATD